MNQNRILKLSRIEALTDGIFAIAMTILILNVSIPHHTASSVLMENLQGNILQKLFIFAGSFVILGTHWIGTDFQHGFLARVNRAYLWINILFLMFICVIPFSASLLASYSHTSIGISFYAINLVFVGIAQLLMWWYANKYQLNVEAGSALVVKYSIYRRIYVGLFLYCISLVAAQWDANIAFVILILPPLIHMAPGAVDKYI
ncbi:MAG: hypothetical protein A3E84_03215 [Gammaproteobacteria bacterium RIFCSPHIGHO2_12_FULL_42_13]|nr:MAG: hypothetical protein A3E84_03215 [Gammaproteobacteria bacterium RIFCSPHIGHO2_12_FULL_42_13]